MATLRDVEFDVGSRRAASPFRTETLIDDKRRPVVVIGKHRPASEHPQGQPDKQR